MGRKLPARLKAEGPEIPEPLVYLWVLFNELSMGLSINGMAPVVVTWEALQAWSRLTSTALVPWEVRALVRLGTLRASIQSEEIRKNTQSNAQNKGR